MTGVSDSYMCQTCGLEHDTVPSARECCIVTEPIVQNVPLPKAAELLGRAAALLHERGKEYDKPGGERSMGRTVAAFNAITGRDLTESEGWLIMSVLKQVRGFTRSGYHEDSHNDLIAYTALMAEAKSEGR